MHKLYNNTKKTLLPRLQILQDAVSQFTVAIFTFPEHLLHVICTFFLCLCRSLLSACNDNSKVKFSCDVPLLDRIKMLNFAVFCRLHVNDARLFGLI